MRFWNIKFLSIITDFLSYDPVHHPIITTFSFAKSTMNHSIGKIHIVKSNYSNICFSRKYGSSAEELSKEIQPKEKGTSSICSETASIACSLFFYLLNFITELLATTGFFSHGTDSPTYLLIIFDFFFALCALCALINSSKKGSTIDLPNSTAEFIDLIVKIINIIAITSLLICTLSSFKHTESPLSYPCAYISLSGAIFMIISSIVSKIILPYCQGSLSEKEKEYA
jgi:hypothetical protein